MEKLIKRYAGSGKLMFPDDNQVVDVSYRISEFQEFEADGLGGQVPTLRNVRGKVASLVGHSAWHPITLLHPGTLTLVMDDGRKLKILMTDSQGSVRGTGEFF